MSFSRRQWIEKIGHALGVAAYILVVFLPLAALAGQSAEWLAGGGGGDLGSGNGTLVNGVLISKPTELKSGDVLQMGETRITVLGPGSTAPLPLEEPTQRRPAP
jgi:pSer/pThr/pTyr-binding forkhead associated (FHA) protein